MDLPALVKGSESGAGPQDEWEGHGGGPGAGPAVGEHAAEEGEGEGGVGL